MFINVTMSCRQVPGLTLAVVSGNQSWIKGFGMADIDTGREVNEHTLFNIGSITKGFTATLIAALLSETQNEFTWNSKISDILEGFSFPDTVRTTMTTLRDILSHRTGLSGLDYGMISGYPTELTREEMTRRMQFVPEVKSFRDDYYYNNIMYMLAGHVTEILGMDSWENLTKKKILQPLNMTHTTFLEKPSQVVADNIAKPYALKNGKLINGTESLYTIHPSEPAGAILSNAEDMAKYMRFLIQKGRVHSGREIVEEKLLSELFNTYNHLSGSIEEGLRKPTFPVDEVDVGYGYGWIIGSYRGYKKVWHSGGLFAYISLLWVYPDMGIGIFASLNGPAVTNLASDALRTIFFYVSDILLGEEPWLNATTACSFPGKWKNSTVRPVSNDDLHHPFNVILDRYVGNYGSHVFPDVHITKDENVLRFQCNRIFGILHPTNKTNKFKLEVTDPWEIVLGNRNANNEITMFPVDFDMDETSAIGFNWTTDAPIPFFRDWHFNNRIPVTGSSSKLLHVHCIMLLCLVCLEMGII
ncbi:hypothetical protein CHS0354_006677 [Potamilus streckersoni]|uniref:Beta-lactamase-related domain-containing protein n=1 Tax=Potamilus streckersoni TaxID=2493646 RepID=A0AAE0SWK3_9BIVA|nr:hypothetical protein CHS0354_006677 [Potamilus streckersoni]